MCQNLRIVPNGMKYLESTNSYATDLDNTKFMMFLPNQDMEETAEFLRNAEQEWNKQDQTSYEFAILLNDVHIGAVSADILNEERTLAELGWIVHKNYWGHGYGFEAAKQIIVFCKKELGIKRLVAHCDSENIGSYRTMEKLGMKRVASYSGRKNRSSLEERMEFRYEMDI